MPEPTHLSAVRRDARARRDAGDLAGARLVLEHALEIAPGVYGEDHPDVLGAAHELAGLHREAGDPAAARRVLEEAIAAGQLRLGDEHPVMLGLAYDLGLVADELGNRHEARRNLARVATAGPAVFGPQDQRVRRARAYVDGAIDPYAETAPGVYDRLDADPITTPGPEVVVEYRTAREAYQPVAGGRPAEISRPRAEPAPPARPVIPSGPEPARRPHRPAGLVIAAALVGVALAAIAAVVVLALREHGEPGRTAGPGPTTAAAARPTGPPTNLRLTAERAGSIALSWNDPAAGQVSFLIAFARRGEQLTVMARLNPGTTRYEANGLNPTLDYCFRVVAVYGTDSLAPSEEACTTRRPRPSATA